MGSIGRRIAWPGQGMSSTIFANYIILNGGILQVQTHCYEAVDLDDLIRVRAIKPAAGVI